MWSFENMERDMSIEAVMSRAKFTVSCAWDEENFGNRDPYDVIRYCEDDKEVEEAVADYIKCGYDVIDVRPYAGEVRLKHCPFCYGEAQIDFVIDSDRYFIHCNDCGAETSKQFKSEQKAIKAWNMRVVDGQDLFTTDDFWD